MNTRIIALFAGLLAVLPMTSAWAGGGGSSTTYYAALKASVSNTGGGKVYAGTNKSAGTYVAPSSTSATQSSTTQNEGKMFYAFAQADSGFEFAGWSTSDGGTVSSTDNPYEVTVKCSSSTEGSPTTTTVWANFKKKVLAAFGITFETSDGGTYTVDGVAPVNKAGLTEATTVKLASSDPNFLNWKVNGKDVVDNPYTATCIADTTISAEFLTADQVAEATTFDELTAALANDGKKKITIPAGVDITIAKGALVTVPDGKQLVLNGSLAVVGTLANSGAISGNGTIFKISYLIEQGEINKPLQVTGEEWGNMAMAYHGYKPYYRVTKTTANTPTVSGTITGCTQSWAVLFTGKAVKISKQSPKALAVTRDTADSASTIKSIADNADTDEIKGNSDYVLLQDCTISGPLDTSSRVSSQKAYDCAGHKATISASKIAGSNMLFMNGVVALTPSSENQNSIATFINCSSMTINKIKNGSPKYYFYDCGSAGVMASLSFAFYNNKSDTTNYRQAYFYSGYYTYTFNAAADATDGGGHSYVYNGWFSSDPTAYLQQGASPNGLKVEGSKSPYKVVENVAAVNCVQVGNTQYASLAEAVSAISSSGTLSLILPVTLKEKLVIPSGKKITIDLNGLNLSGGSIENSGALRFEDNSGAAQPGTLSTPVVGKAGTIDITFGAYAGSFRMEGGVLTTHNGTFASTFAATEAGGQVMLRGGCFKGTVAVPDGYCQRSGYIGQKVVGYIADASKIGDADASYLVMGFSPNDVLGLEASDETLYLNFMQNKSGWASRSDFVGREALWDRLAELRSTGEPIKNQAFEASISFDRAVSNGTVAGWAKIRGETREMDMDQDLDPEEDYHILIPLVTGAGYTAKSFKHMFDGEDGGVWEQVHCGVENKSLDNIGTTVTVKFQIRMGGQKAGYTFETERSRSYKFAGNGAIAGGVDYSSLATAVEKIVERGTIRLSKDCDENVSVGKVCTIDMNNFVFTGKIEPAEGFEVSQSGGLLKVYKPVEIKNGDEESTIAAIPEIPPEVTQTAKERAEENGTTIEMEEQKVLQETNPDTGLKVWQEVVLKNAGVTVEPSATFVEVAQPVESETPENTITLTTKEEIKDAGLNNAVQGVALAKVSQGGEKTLVLDPKDVKRDQSATVDLTDLPSGIYQPVLVVNDAAGNPQACADKNAPNYAIVRNESKEKTVILPVPGKKLNGQEAKVSDVIDVSSLANGDTVTYYNPKDGTKSEWKYENGAWSDSETQKPDGSLAVVKPDLSLPAGGAFWLTRANPEMPVVIVTEMRDEISAPELEQKKTADDEPVWNLEANPDPVNEVKLDDVVKNPVAGDEIIIPTSNGAQKKVSLNNGKWTYKKSVLENGRIKKVDAQATVGAGQGFWYLSNGTEGGEKTSIKWK